MELSLTWTVSTNTNITYIKANRELGDRKDKYTLVTLTEQKSQGFVSGTLSK